MIIARTLLIVPALSQASDPTAVPLVAERGNVCGSDSDGCAAGSTPEEASLRGFCELAERDAFACRWCNRASSPQVDPEGFGDGHSSGARACYRAVNPDLWVLNATYDVGIPAAKTIMPALRHFWVRFGPGRMYDVPARTGWRETPTLEADPIAVFI